jgi:hypothetical protein
MLAAVLIAETANAQTSFRTGTLHGRKAYILENGTIRVTALQGGGHIGEIRFLSDDANKSMSPFYVPAYQTIEPYEYDPEKHKQQFGSALGAGYMGHLLCFPMFGPASADEAKRGLGGHGEAATVEWKQLRPAISDSNGVTLHYGADLPKTQYRVARTITLPANETVVYVEETFENLAIFDRPYNRDGHATFGMPFVTVGKNFLDTSAERGMIQVRANHSLLSGREITQWPQGFGPNGRPVDLRGVQPIPKTNTLYALALPQSRPMHYFTLYNTDYPILVGFLLPSSDHSWLVDWQNNQGDRFMRGIEFGTSPYDEGLKRSVERGSLLGLPTYGWIGAGAKTTIKYAIFFAEIPADFKGVQSLEKKNAQIVITERETGRQTTLPSSRD